MRHWVQFSRKDIALEQDFEDRILNSRKGGESIVGRDSSKNPAAVPSAHLTKR